MNKLFLLAFLVSGIAASAQQQILTDADYARAEQFLSYKTYPLITRNKFPGDTLGTVVALVYANMN